MTMFKSLIVGLIIILALLEYRFWFGSDSIIKEWDLKKALVAQEQELNALKARNNFLIGNINNLKKFPISVEEQARYELGMVKQNEKYYQVVEPLD